MKAGREGGGAVLIPNRIYIMKCLLREEIEENETKYRNCQIEWNEITLEIKYKDAKRD